MAEATADVRISNLETKYDNIMSKIDMFIAEMRDRDNQRAAEIRDRDNQRAAEMRELRARDDKLAAEIRERDDKLAAEMRDRDNKRAAEIREINARIESMQAKFDDKFTSHMNQLHNMAIATMLGIGAMVVTVIYSVTNR